MKKEIVEIEDGSHTEYYNCRSDCWYYSQDENKLLKTGVFRREYGDCELGTKCPIKQNYKIESIRKNKNTLLLSNVQLFL